VSSGGEGRQRSQCQRWLASMTGLLRPQWQQRAWVHGRAHKRSRAAQSARGWSRARRRRRRRRASDRGTCGCPIDRLQPSTALHGLQERKRPTEGRQRGQKLVSISIALLSGLRKMSAEDLRATSRELANLRSRTSSVAAGIIPVAISFDLTMPAFAAQIGLRITPRAGVSSYANGYNSARFARRRL
jgi:hypothetical protein